MIQPQLNTLGSHDRTVVSKRVCPRLTSQDLTDLAREVRLFWD